MFMKLWGIIIAFLIFLHPIPTFATAQNVFFREAFNDLSNWEPLYFPKIEKHSTYKIENVGGRPILKAESNASASAIVCRKTFNVYEFPLMRWRWKVDNVYKKGNILEKSGDDYPIRIYVIFQYDPGKASLTEKVTYSAARLLYGKYPPHSTLNYVWTGQAIAERIITSPYTGKAKMVILENGKTKVGAWVDETVNILEDYKKAFGEEPPATAGIAIMNDSDNTGEKSVSFVEFIEVFR